MRRASVWSLAFLGYAVLIGDGSAYATDLELVTRANPPSDTPRSATNFGASLFLPSFSDDERYVAFSSISPNLIVGQSSPPSSPNIFLWDRTTGASVLVSRTPGNPLVGAGGSQGQDISSDGRYVAFLSTAPNLVAGQVDAPDTSDVFLWDRTTGVIRLVSHARDSAVTAADRPTYRFDLSADGRYVAFLSDASNFLPGGSTTSAAYLWDRDSGNFTLISHRAGLPSEPAQGLLGTVSISGDGGIVAFDSLASDLVVGQVDTGQSDVFVWSRATNQSFLASRRAGTVATADPFADSFSPRMSRNGRWLLFRSSVDDLIPGGDGNSLTDVYLYDVLGGTNTLVSHESGQPNAGADSFSSGLAVSADAEEVLFSSLATNLVPGQVDTNGESDLFLWRRALDQTVLVSHRTEGAQMATLHGGFGGSMSADGRFAAFNSTDPDLVAGQNDPPTSSSDVFLFDRDSGVVSLVSHRSGSATEAANGESVEPILSPGGHFLTFTTLATDVLAGIEDWNLASDLFLFDLGTGLNRLITRVGEASDTQTIYFDFSPSRGEISLDGRWVAFNSGSSNLTGGTRKGSVGNVFLRDRQTGTTRLVSRAAGTLNDFGTDGQSYTPSLSADGRYLAYQSEALDLVGGQVDTLSRSADVFLYDREANGSILVSHRPGQTTVSDINGHFTRLPKISGDGRFVAYYSSRTQNETDAGLYLFDRTTGLNELISHLPGQPGTPAMGLFDDLLSLSADGRFVAYSSTAQDLIAGGTDTNNTQDVFLFDRTTGENRLLSHVAGSSTQAVGLATEPTISADGRFVAFTGFGTELLPGPSTGGYNVYLWDREADILSLVSHTPGGNYGNQDSRHPAISADGRFVAFSSQATDLVAGQADTVETPDAFLFDRVTGAVVLASHAPGASTVAIGTLDSPGLPALSADGRKLAFATSDGIAVAGQTAPGGLFVYDRATDSNLLASHRSGDAARPGNAPGLSATFSADGSSTCFSSTADDLVPRDHNDVTDLFVHTISTAAATGTFFTLPPCRLVDTRTFGQGPALASTAIRAVTASGICGVPPSAKAAAVTLTVTGATGGGHLSVFPGNLSVPATAALNFSAAQTRSSNAVVPLATNGAGTLGLSAFVAASGTVEAIVDVFGYFE